MQRKRETRPSLAARERAIDLMVAAYDNTYIRATLTGIYRGCLICSAVLGTSLLIATMHAAGVI